MLQVAAGATQVCGSPSESWQTILLECTDRQLGLVNTPMRNADYGYGQRRKMPGHVFGSRCDTYVKLYLPNGVYTPPGQSISPL